MSKVRSQTSLSSLAGEDFGPYRLVRRLGVGGMAETYEAIRRGPSGFAQHVCLKLVLPFFRDNEDFIRLFEREARLAAKLRHSNIVGVIDFGKIAGTPYMAIELVDGADLRVVLDAQDGVRLPHGLVALLGHDLAAALEHAHSRRPGNAIEDSDGDAIVHRDVSPSNVLISRTGEVFLSDFGVAKAMSGTSRKQSAVKGKIPYMSPEQLRAEPLDGRADLFALGVVLYEALAGQRPYDGAHDPATIMLTLSGDHPSLHSLAPAAPPGLCEVIESLLLPNREDRPESASKLIDLLDEFVPSPRARRDLGRIVAESRPPKDRISTEDLLALAGGKHATDPGPDPGPSDAGASASATDGLLVSERWGANNGARRSFQRALVGLLLVMVGAAGAIGLWPTIRREDQTRSETRGALAPPPTADPKPRAPPLPGPEERKRDVSETKLDAAEEATVDSARDIAPAAAALPRPARLTVVVFPWGNVWIDGKLRGAAPLKDQPLKAGRYKIGVGQERPFKTQTIRLRPGERKSLDFDLTK